MSDIRHCDRILEAIDNLRRLKRRPDMHRISNFMMRRFGVIPTETKVDLQKCVERDIVLKVEYKGSISYRNAAKKFTRARREGESRPVGNAIAELIVHEPNYLEVGVPDPELIKNIISKDNVRYTKKYAGILLEKEVENGGLVRMENSNFLVGQTKPDALMFKKKERNKPRENGIVRVGSRRKVAKKVFDPSDNNLPKKRGRPVGSLNKSKIQKQLPRLHDSDSRPESRSSIGSREQGGVCSVCHNNNKKVPSNRVVACRECTNKGRDKESSPGSSMSDDSNHNLLLPSPTPPMLSLQASHMGATSAAASPEIECSMSDSQSIKDLDVDDIIDPSIPDATHWTCEDVYNYFAEYFPEEAEVFREQEIDGRSLLLMKRMDVLTGLKLKLGRALKIYRHVVKLQFRRDDPKLHWL